MKRSTSEEKNSKKKTDKRKGTIASEEAEISPSKKVNTFFLFLHTSILFPLINFVFLQLKDSSKKKKIKMSKIALGRTKEQAQLAFTSNPLFQVCLVLLPSSVSLSCCQ